MCIKLNSIIVLKNVGRIIVFLIINRYKNT